MRDKLSTVIGFGLLTLLLTAGAAQSLAGTNTVTSDDIVDGTIITPDLKTGALSGSKILDNAVTGLDVNEATLVLTCKTGMARIGDICYGEEGPLVTQADAIDGCTDDRLRLPSLSEARMILNALSQTTGSLWTDVWFMNGASHEGYSALGNGGWAASSTGNPQPYRCVTTVGSRP